MVYPRLLLGCLCIAALACNNSNPQQTSNTSIPAAEDTLAQMPGSGAKSSVSTDEQLFGTAFGSFKTAVEQNSEDQLKGMMHFPLSLKTGELSDADFHSKYKEVFNADVRNLVPKAGEENIKKVDANNQEAYYTQLRKITDKDSKLFEMHTAQTGNHFVFVFGRVQGTYKIVGYYSK
jgi:hypothetical protein